MPLRYRLPATSLTGFEGFHPYSLTAMMKESTKTTRLGSVSNLCLLLSGVHTAPPSERHDTKLVSQ